VFNNRGFTLIELLVSLIIFSLGMLGIMAMQLTSITTNRRAYTMNEALNFAESKIEEMRSGAVTAAGSELEAGATGNTYIIEWTTPGNPTTVSFYSGYRGTLTEWNQLTQNEKNEYLRGTLTTVITP
jgi:type IV pilus assembly protein PilV